MMINLCFSSIKGMIITIRCYFVKMKEFLILKELQEPFLLNSCNFWKSVSKNTLKIARKKRNNLVRSMDKLTRILLNATLILTYLWRVKTLKISNSKSNRSSIKFYPLSNPIIQILFKVK
jgi:hypothetical protein